MIGKLFGWTRYRISHQERAESEKAVQNAADVAVVAAAIRDEAQRVGARQVALREENGFGKNLTHVFRNAI